MADRHDGAQQRLVALSMQLQLLRARIRMHNSGTTVANSKNANAPIFAFAGFGIIGDVQPVVRKLTVLVKRARA